ncbi:hypothetical protein L6Q96_20260 [Candidatus Binatia bacterium]|nr:hypothetical protein [Candidatus Binatia bacterium]
MGETQVGGVGRHWRVRIVLAGALVALSVIGLALVDAGAAVAHGYFHGLVVAFAAVSLWEHTLPTGDWSWRNLRGLVLHWLGFVGAFNMLFALERQGLLQRNEVALVALILLGLTVYLAGIYYDPTFLIVGPAVALAAVLAAFVEEYVFVILLVVALVVVVVLVLWRVASRRFGG